MLPRLHDPAYVFFPGGRSGIYTSDLWQCLVPGLDLCSTDRSCRTYHNDGGGTLYDLTVDDVSGLPDLSDLCLIG